MIRNYILKYTKIYYDAPSCTMIHHHVLWYSMVQEGKRSSWTTWL